MTMMYQNPIRINLMPHREALKDSRKKQFFTRAILVAALAGVLMLLAWQLIEQYVNNQLDKNTFISAEIKKLDVEITQIATLQQEIDALKARQKSVEDLQADRNLPVYVFEELTSYVPEGVFLKSIRQDARKITMTGIAQTQERVSEMLRNFSNASVWLESPELLEIKLASATATIKSSDKLYDFTIAVQAKREKKTSTTNVKGVAISVTTPVKPSAKP
jgi:type IV pilus assembly protein PilN